MLSNIAYNDYGLVLQAINLFSQGRTITDACQRIGVSYRVVKHYVEHDERVRELYEEADALSQDAMAEALVNIDNHEIHGQSDARMAKVVSDNIKWILARRNPEKFGERIQIKHDVSVDLVITTALNNARNRLLPSPANDVIDAVMVPESEDAIMEALLR